MKRKKPTSPYRNNYVKYNYLKTILIKSIIVIFFLLVLLLVKKINHESANNVLTKIDSAIRYEFNMADGKKYLDKAMSQIDNSLSSISVFNQPSEKIGSPISGTIHKEFGQDVYIDGQRVKNNGLDIKSEDESNPIVLLEGIVSKIENRGTKGYYISILSGDTEITYGYITNPLVLEGEKVKFGDGVGELGTNKDGIKYLRFEIQVDGQYVDPMNYIDL